MKTIVSILLTAVLSLSLLSANGESESDSSAQSMDIHFLVPGGAGGGWDGTARGVGQVLVDTGLIDGASYENMSGGGGGVAIAHFIKTANSKLAERTLMVNSTPIIARSLSKVFPQSFRDLVPVAGVIAEFQGILVSADSPYTSWRDIVDELIIPGVPLKIAGGSVIGATDHISAVLAVKESGGDPASVEYLSYDGGGDAMTALLSGEAAFLSTGAGEALKYAQAGQVRFLAVSAPERWSDAPEVPTFVEQGYDVIFANWRGFFAAPGTPDEKVRKYNELFAQMYDSLEWERTRAREGWFNQYIPHEEFIPYLEDQEALIRRIMIDIGFI